jgi:FtsH-binding integral membrane protein
MDLKKIYAKMFYWMFVGLLVTFLTAYTVSQNTAFLVNVFNFWWLFALLEIGLVIWLSAGITKMKPMTARILFIVYSLVTGLTFGSIFIIYKLTSIIFIFLVTAGLCLLMGLLGHFTKLDLSKLGTFLFIGLIGIILCSVINIFVGSESFSLGIAIVTVIIFLIYVAYDIKKVSHLLEILPEDNLAIYGALQLYLDFINIFLSLLRLFGKGRD